MRKVIRSAGLALALTLAAAAQAPAAPKAPAAETVAYINGHWWTGSGFAAGDRYVRGGVFVRKGKAARTVDLKGAYVTPPFGEAHNHNLDRPETVRPVSDQYLANGVFYVKIPNSRSYTAETRKLLNGKDSVDAIFSMGGITAPGGHPIRLYGFLSRFPGPAKPGESFEGDAFHLVRTAADIEPVLQRLQDQGADFIKTYLLGSETYEARKDDPAAYGMKGLDPKLFPKVVRAAHRRGLKVSVHIETAADFRTAVAGGVDEINHLPGYMWPAGTNAETFRLTQADAKAAKRAGVVVVTTTGVTNGINSSRKAEIKALQAQNLKLLHAAGVKIAIGSDNYMTTSRSEIENLLAIGAFDAPTLLKLWIDTSKVAIFPGRRIGCLDPGCEADFLALRRDPVTDLAATREIAFAWKDGQPLALKPIAPSMIPGMPGAGGHAHED